MKLFNSTPVDPVMKLLQILSSACFAVLIQWALPGCAQVQTEVARQQQSVDTMIFPFTLSEAEWKEKLSPQQYYILREKGTERGFTGPYWNNKTSGSYSCAGCGQVLFSSETKFDSGTGWPSFWKPVNEKSILEEQDFTYGMVRTEVLCMNCGGHLGHVFDDGPEPTGLRYCINGHALSFSEK
jgi:peptide-methionine (R)-S-oxide reductase